MLTSGSFNENNTAKPSKREFHGSLGRISVLGGSIAIILLCGTAYLMRPLVGDYFLRKAKVASFAGDYERSECLIDKSCLYYPHDFEAWFFYGYLLQKMKRYADSLATIRRSLDLHRNYPFSYNIQGVDYHYSGDIARAEESYKKALALDPTYETARKNLALLFKERGRIDKAIEEYLKAEANEPLDEEIKIDIGLMYYEIGDLQKAEEYFRKVLALRPFLLNCDGIMHIPKEKYRLFKNGEKIYFRVDARNKYNRELRNWTDWGSLVISSVEEGRIEIENPPFGCNLKYDPKTMSLVLRIANVRNAYKYTLQLKTRKKVVDFEIPANAVSHAKALNNLGIVYARRGEIKAARQYFEEAIEACKEYLPPYRNMIIHYLYNEPSYERAREMYAEYQRQSSGAGDMDYLLGEIEKLKAQ